MSSSLRALTTLAQAEEERARRHLAASRQRVLEAERAYQSALEELERAQVQPRSTPAPHTGRALLHTIGSSLADRRRAEELQGSLARFRADLRRAREQESEARERLASANGHHRARAARLEEAARIESLRAEAKREEDPD